WQRTDLIQALSYRGRQPRQTLEAWRLGIRRGSRRPSFIGGPPVLHCLAGRATTDGTDLETIPTRGCVRSLPDYLGAGLSIHPLGPWFRGMTHEYRRAPGAPWGVLAAR